VQERDLFVMINYDDEGIVSIGNTQNGPLTLQPTPLPASTTCSTTLLQWTPVLWDAVDSAYFR
jgi:hypothetical protein